MAMRLETMRKHIQKYFDTHTSKMELNGVKFEILEKKNMPKFYWNCDGIAYSSQRLVILQKEYLEKTWGEQDKIEDLVIHELMHIFVNKKYGANVKSHGKEFRRECANYGIHPAISGYKRFLEESRGVKS
jgi:predicted SprT family Zn-dependent metalloprotease